MPLLLLATITVPLSDITEVFDQLELLAKLASPESEVSVTATVKELDPSILV